MRLRKVKQHDIRDCGAAAFATIVNTYGDHLSLAKARELVHTSKDGSTMYGLSLAAEKIGFISEVLSEEYEGELLEYIDCGKITLPLIAHMRTPEGMTHFVIIYKRNRTSFSIFDPGSGDKKQSFADFNKTWTKVVMTLYPGESWQPMFSKNERFHKYFVIISNLKSRIFWTILVSLIISAISIIGSMLYKKVIDSFILKDVPSGKITNDNFIIQAVESIISHFNYLFIAVIILYLFQALLSILRAYFIADLSVKSGKRLFLDLFAKLMKLPIDFFANRESGDLLARFQIVSEFQDRLSEIIITIFLEIFMAIAGGIVLFKISAPLFGITCLLVLSYLIVTLIFIKPLKTINSKIIDANSASLTVYTEAIDGVEEIKMAGSASHFLGIFHKKIDELLDIGKNGIILQNIQIALVFLLESLGVVLILWEGSRLVIKDMLTLGSLMSFETLIFFFVSPLKNIIQKQKEIQDLFVMADKLDDIFEVTAEDLSTKMAFPKLNGLNLSLQNLSFSYGASELILKEITFIFENGHHYAITGRSGAGKTSLLKMIATLTKPDSGKIFLNGVPVQENLAEYRKKVSFLPNNPILFAGSIRENLLMGTKNIPEVRLLHVVHSVGLNELLEDLPEGIESKLTAKGKNLSSGQRQRIAIARALINLPEILLLDEALSNLDSKAQAEIMDFISQEMKDKILISISHDVKLNSFADTILEIKDGKLLV